MEHSMLVLSLRVAFVFCLYFMTLVCYLAPVLIAKYLGSKNQLGTSPSQIIKNKKFAFRLISWCNCTATGIFLAMCFLGILPYVEQMFHTIFRKAHYEIKFPFAECFIVCGFILTLLVEQSILTWRERTNSCLQEDTEQNRGLLDECEMQDLTDDRTLLHDEILTNEQTDSIGNAKFSAESDQGIDVSISNRMELEHSHNHFPLMLYHKSGFPVLFLSLATGIHCIFEGITLGLQNDVTKAIHLFIAIIIHSCLLSAALGINSIRLKYSFVSYLKFAIILSSAMPVGLLIGVLIRQTPGIVGEIVSAITQSLSAGVFLHVSFQNFLPSEFSNNQDRLLKVLFLALGYIIIAIVTFFIN